MGCGWTAHPWDQGVEGSSCTAHLVGHETPSRYGLVQGCSHHDLAPCKSLGGPDSNLTLTETTGVVYISGNERVSLARSRSPSLLSSRTLAALKLDSWALTPPSRGTSATAAFETLAGGATALEARQRMCRMATMLAALRGAVATPFDVRLNINIGRRLLWTASDDTWHEWENTTRPVKTCPFYSAASRIKQLYPLHSSCCEREREMSLHTLCGPHSIHWQLPWQSGRL